MIDYQQFVELPEFIVLQQSIKARNENLIESEIYKVVKAKICTYDDIRLGNLPASLNDYKKMFSG